MKQGFAVLAATAGMLVLPSAASAADQFVDPAGVDSGNCTVGAPCEHIQTAVDNALANDTVTVAAGTYDSEPNNQVVVNKGLIITARESDPRSSTATPPAVWSSPARSTSTPAT